MALLEVEDLTVVFHTDDGPVPALEGVTYEIRQGETVGIVGESGAGKTVASLAIMQLLDRGGEIVSGSLRFDGRELRDCSSADLRELRGEEIAMVFQDPEAALNPVYTVGEQVAETIRAHRSLSRGAARERAIETLATVNVPAPADRYGDYPHELSGGLKQRVCLAMALACEPSVLICDEPTTALDVTIQAQILDLLEDLVATRDMAMQLVTHDMGIVAEHCDRAVVLYAGSVVERAPVDALFYDPQHPYTAGLLASIPHLDGEALTGLPGTMPPLSNRPTGCRFHPRCPFAEPVCADSEPPLVSIGSGEAVHEAACLAHTGDLEGQLTYDVEVGRTDE